MVELTLALNPTLSYLDFWGHNEHEDDTTSTTKQSQ